MELCAECPVAAIYLRENLWLIKAKGECMCSCTYDDLYRIVSVWFYDYFFKVRNLPITAFL